MPEQETLKRVQKDKREGKAPSTQAGEFVREEIHHIREGKHGARSTKQAIAIGLSKARRAGVKLQAPPNQDSKTRTTTKKRHAPSRRRSRATFRALQREGREAASHRALSRQARTTPRRRRTARRKTENG